MAETYARGIAVLLCLLAFPSLAAGQDAPVPSSVAQGATEDKSERSASAPAASADRNFVETMADGVKSVFSKESVPLLSSAAALTLFALPFDETLTYSASCSTFLKTTFEGWARIGGQEWVLAGGSLATYVIGRATDQPKVAALGGDLVQAQVVAGVSTFALKFVTQRARPDGEPRSFPSGHAAGTFAAATVVQRHYGLKGAIPAYTAAVLISGARLQANSHYATDIIMGAAVGILSGRAATFELGRHRVSLTPAVTEGGVLVAGTIR
jgi:membrane-associated phospholipid phosphatase